ncbi:hypothetical protein K493DRAFT_304522 [Basidiobolus meristosporus CBS 931.73]|uniref:Glycosyltransferase family 69 protein n=1 Tax=Basidiobolus meristosporus CBS 931.73 TaxID=1314790 RepID=A0A1Y1XYR2_9FUNG|nr:hypothetical protein K493DRAFT_304522 [Basidiobolus meristosporus CBS 931.73]|eukprot:ORX90897.1 hypothetical protein K493DRAFT_304522 [Basidiobolus meristosporus CBS 931.73]
MKLTPKRSVAVAAVVSLFLFNFIVLGWCSFSSYLIFYHLVKYILIQTVFLILVYLYSQRSGDPSLLSKPYFQLAIVCFGLVLFIFCVQDLTAPALSAPDIDSSEKYFIAANLYNNEAILPQWSRELLRLVSTLGPASVYISIVESNSKDGTKQFLRKFDKLLDQQGIRHRIRMSDDADTSNRIINRIPFMAEIRNQALEPFYETYSATNQSERYDRILFFNDIVFTSEQILHLLDTNQGNYDMACSIDFDYSGLYDRWVARDRNGRLVSMYYPFIQDLPTQQLLRDRQDFPVYSCWNGVVALDTKPFYAHQSLKFRSSKEGECYSSECFLLPSDLQDYGYKKIFMNPRVLVTYDYTSYFLWNELLRWKFAQVFMEYSGIFPLESDYWIRGNITQEKNYECIIDDFH